MMDCKKLTLYLDGVINDLPKTLEKYNVEQIDTNILQLQYKPSELNVEEILAALRHAGIKLKDISTEEPDLEDIFRLLIKQKHRTHEAA